MRLSSHKATMAAIYRTTSGAAWVGAVLPSDWHPGKRARVATCNAHVTGYGARFARAVLDSHCKARLLRAFVSSSDRESLQGFLTRQVYYDSATAIHEIATETRPIIIATPHYGEPMVGAIALSHALRGRKTVNLFYDRGRHGPLVQPILERAGVNAELALGGHAGIRKALRALAAGECLALLPDAFDDISQTVVVPFLGRFLRVASGTAFLALRSGALIVPAFAMPTDRFGLHIRFGEPIDPLHIGADDEGQTAFTLMHLLFSRIEAQLQTAPEHWRYWEALPHVSTPIGKPMPLDQSDLLRTLRARFRALPPSLQDIPELELLLE